MRISVVLLEFGAITLTRICCTAHVYRVHLKVAGIEEWQLLLDFERICRLAFYEKNRTQSQT